MAELILPRTFECKTGKYKNYNGRPKLSYSQYKSWKSNYRNDYIKQYFCGLELPDSIWARTGNDTGEYIEWRGNGMIDPRPKSIILKQNSFDNIDNAELIDYPENCVYEDQIVVDCGDFVVEGYTDRTRYFPENNSVHIRDYKTGNISKKADYYASEEYQQLQLYGFGKQQENYNVEQIEVVMLHRKGNGSEKSPIHLTGETLLIPLEYSKDKALSLLDDMSKVAKEISDVYKTYLKYFNNG